MRTLALVPARGGSKGIPHKNTREFKGLPLLAHAIRVGQATCDQTVVSTEDMETACLAASYGAAVQMRPEELAQDETPMLPVIQHVLANMADKPDVVVLLQPSSPSPHRAAHVMAALAFLEASGADSIVSVTEIPPHYSPEAACRVEDGRLRPFFRQAETSYPYYMDSLPTRRQDTRPAYHRDGTVYVIRREVLASNLYGDPCIPLILPAHESATIDTEGDWALAEAKHG